MSVYDDVEREARADHRAWLADEYEPIEGIDFDRDEPSPRPASNEPSPWDRVTFANEPTDDFPVPF